jgi:hypothetical protein
LLGYAGKLEVSLQYCDEMPESQNKGVISYATDKGDSIVTTRQTTIFVATTIRCMTTQLFD